MVRLYGTFPDGDVERKLSAGPESDVITKVIMALGAVLVMAGMALVWLHVVSGRIMLFVLLGVGVGVMVGAVVRARTAGPLRREEALRAMRAHKRSHSALARPVLGDDLATFLGADAAASFVRGDDGQLAWHERVDGDGRMWRAFVMWYPIEGDGRGHFAYETARDRFAHMPDSLEVEVTYAQGDGGEVVFLSYEGEDDAFMGRMPLEAAFLCGDGSPVTAR